MNFSWKTGEHPWRVTIAAVGGLLVAIIAVGVVGLLVNRDIKSVTDDALRHDVEIEDDGDDIRAAVLDLRHYQRNIYFEGPSRAQIANLEGAQRALLHEISEFESPGVRGYNVAQPQELRTITEEYYTGFRSATAEYQRTGEQAAFDEANDLGLRRIAALEQDAAEIDELGENLTEDSVAGVDQAATSAALVLLTVIGGLFLAGVVLSYAAVRVVQELRAASRAKTDFLADASHELRTPLTVLRGNAQIGLSLDGNGHQKEIFSDIVEESSRMARIVEDLLFLARSDSDSLPLEMKPIPVAALLLDLEKRTRDLARERGALLETELSGEGEASLDQSRVEQALIILVDNAAKYGPPEGVITLSSETRAGKLHITVADRGAGIPEEELSRVFERFYRLDKTRSRKLGGSGLGLPIARTIIEGHGGRIEAKNRADGGTAMSIHLPLIPGGKQSEPASSGTPARRE